MTILSNASAAQLAELQAAAGSPRLTNPKGLRRWRAAFADAQFAPAHIQVIGHSIADGIGTENSSTIVNNDVADRFCWAGQTRDLLAKRTGLLGGSILTPFFDGADSRVTKTGTPTTDKTTGLLQRGARLLSTQSITFSTPACTNVDILYYDPGASNFGGFTYQIDGGTVVTGQAAGSSGSEGYKVLSITGLANAAHTVQLVGLNSTNFTHIDGLRYHNGAGVTVGRFAKSGYTLLDALGIGVANDGAIGNTSAQARILNAFGAWGSALTIVMLDINDAVQQATDTLTPQRSDLATYETYMRQVVAKVAANGGCTLLLNANLPGSAWPVSVPAGGAPFYAYHDVCRKIAGDTDHVAQMSVADRWGVLNDRSSADSVALGLLSSTSVVHPPKRGHGDIASQLFAALTRQDLFASA